ncbi:glycosyltransferase [Aurantimonas aggregata]|uniref:Glycosyltransferase n=1 Tax=Aurantimonas aggregata TaxID=2047720 RepID=A0A6L9MP53_9HYPH|nr:glycosyltransferase [Aurantimonas aggregata]NDV89472.1 glycosyltransferase [Aurantimonas aggregata]
MRISIETLGTRGDVQPYLALALGLMQQGYEVQFAAPKQFASFVEEKGVRFAPLPGEFLALLDTPDGKAAVAGGQGFSAGFKLLKHIKPLMRRLLDEEWAAVKAFNPDLIVYHPKSVAVPHFGERLGIPVILASPLPGFTPTRAFPSPMLPVSSLGPFNKMSHLLAMRGADVLFGKMLGQWRETSLGLMGRKANVAPIATVYAYSRHVVPVPSDWGERVLVSGYWFLDEGADWQMSDCLKSFLAAGDKPIYVGFGSMPGIDPRMLAQEVIEGLARAGKRGLLATGGGALDMVEVPSHVHVIAAAPHDQLFKHVGAALHHGGAGTTGASLRAGLPTIICPFFGDQPFWGRRVAALGAGPQPLDRKTLDATTLAAAFKTTDDPVMRARAGAIGTKIGHENGVAAAVSFVGRTLKQQVS